MKIMRENAPFKSLAILASVEGQFAAATGNDKAAAAWQRAVDACELAHYNNGLFTRWLVQQKWKEAAMAAADPDAVNSISMY